MRRHVLGTATVRTLGVHVLAAIVPALLLLASWPLLPAASATQERPVGPRFGEALSPLVSGPASGPGSLAGRDRGRTRAEEALAAARGMLMPGRSVSGQSQAPGRGQAGDATLVMRELALSLKALAPPEQLLARALLARPTDSASGPTSGVRYGGAGSVNDCEDAGGESRPVCLHWVSDPADRHAPPEGWVPVTQQVLAEVWQGIVVDLGYRPPRQDTGSPGAGPDGRLDVYLAELGRTKGLYGYCAPEWTGGSRAAAYCVLDNDFAEFDGDPLDLLKVTAAHEIFHAVQMAYAVRADVWVSEGTAAWVEDEIFDEVDDNLQYLAFGPLTRPSRPLDLAPDPEVHGWRAYNWRYGSWIWWRFLSESSGTRARHDPTVVRDVWDNLARGQRTATAMQGALAARGRPFGRAFADFGAVNLRARQWYSEGHAYRQAPVALDIGLTRRQRSTGWRSRTLDHLSTQHVTVRPGRGLTGRWRARIGVDAPDRVRGSQVTVTLERPGGRVVRKAVRLDGRGDARLTVPFGRREVARIAISLTNASLRMRGCGDPTSPYSCAGWSRDDSLPFRFRVTALR